MTAPCVLAVLAASLVLAAVGCGDDDGDGIDEVRIVEAIERAATSGDPKVCTEVQTQRFVEQTVGDGVTGAAAVRQCRKNARRGVAERVEVTNVKIDGTAATAHAAVTGSTFDGQTLVIALVKHAHRWKLDELKAFERFDRDALLASFAEEVRAEGATPPAVTCLTRQLAGMSDPELQGFFLGSDPDAPPQAFAACREHFTD
jgi:hypothetical protein